MNAPHERPWGRLTIEGDSRAEAEVTTILREARDLLRDVVPERRLRALLLIGGYGRGEGGVELREGRLRPHNNLDFLFVTRGLDAEERATLLQRAELAVDPLRRRASIGIDLSAIDEWRLRCSPSLVMWCDMRHGHKTILGDSQFAPGLTQFRVEAIPHSDVRDLLVNRGTLLVINDWLWRRHTAQLARRRRPWESTGKREAELLRTTRRHRMKAIIGYGDALLFFHGLYHWSYVEKRRRMTSCPGASDEFRRAYDEALAFRQRPDYSLGAADAVAGLDAERSRQHSLLPLLEQVHLNCESRRLGQELSGWENYAPRYLGRLMTQDAWSPTAWLRRLARWRRSPAIPESVGGAGERWALAAGGPRARLALAFPAIVYGAESLRERAAAVLGAPAANEESLRHAYLEAWSRWGDGNFDPTCDDDPAAAEREVVATPS